MKKIISMAFVIILALSCFGIEAFAGSGKKSYTVTCKTAADVMDFVLEDGPHAVPIRIVKAKLRRDGVKTNVYLVGLVGVESGTEQTNNINSCIKAGFGKTSDYFDEAKAVILDVIPKGANLLLAGHSLGGMTLQQISVDSEIKERYNIINTMTAGSPYVKVKEEREGELHRLADKYDAIPWMSVALVTNPKKLIKEVSREDGGYLWDPDGAHNLSYRDNEIWGEYDALGVKDGNAVITFDHANIKIYGEAKPE